MTLQIFSGLTHPVSIKWELTYKCNMRCLHCGVCGGDPLPHELTATEARHVCTKVGHSKAITVLLAGGEALLRKDFFQIAQELTDYDMVLTFESNGWYLNSETVETLAKTGFKCVKVSLDGVNAQPHDRLRNAPGSWERAVHGIQNLIEHGIEATVGFCPVEFNIAEIGDLIDFCVELGISRINTGELAPQGRAFINWEQLAPSKEQYNRFFSTLDEKSEEYKGEIALAYTRNIMKNISTQWSSPPAHIHIAPSGKIRLSSVLPFVLGDIRHHTIDELFGWYKNAWRTEKVRAYLQKIQHMEDFLKYPHEIPYLNYEEELACE